MASFVAFEAGSHYLPLLVSSLNMPAAIPFVLLLLAGIMSASRAYIRAEREREREREKQRDRKRDRQRQTETETERERDRERERERQR